MTNPMTANTASVRRAMRVSGCPGKLPLFRLHLVGSFVSLRIEDPTVPFNQAWEIMTQARLILEDAGMVKFSAPHGGLQLLEGGIVMTWERA